MKIALAITPRQSTLTVADILPGETFRTVLGEPAALLMTSISETPPASVLDAIEPLPRRHVVVDLGTGDMARMEACIEVVRLEVAPCRDVGVLALADASGVLSPARESRLVLPG